MWSKIQIFLVVALRKESVDRNIVVISSKIADRVALRKESVDRNTSPNPASLFNLPSLSARRAWIEIATPTTQAGKHAVALRKESVDRNQGVHYDNYNLHCRSPQGERG